MSAAADGENSSSDHLEESRHTKKLVNNIKSLTSKVAGTAQW